MSQKHKSDLYDKQYDKHHDKHHEKFHHEKSYGKQKDLTFREVKHKYKVKVSKKGTEKKHSKLKHPSKKNKHLKETVGWQEWCALPKLHLPAIKAKIDTGAKTSALHAWDIHTFHRLGELYVHFTIHPLQRDLHITQICSAKVVDQRMVMNSGGNKEHRYVISTSLLLGKKQWEIEITLTNRDPMAFRMLLGRDALKKHMIVDPSKIMRLGKLTQEDAQHLYLQRYH